MLETLTPQRGARLLAQAMKNIKATSLVEVRVLKAKETAIHAAADAHVAKLSVALRYAFAMARKVIRPMLAEMRTAGFNEDQPRDESGRWTDGSNAPAWKPEIGYSPIGTHKTTDGQTFHIYAGSGDTEGTYTARVGDKEVARIALRRSKTAVSSANMEDEYRRKGIGTKLYDAIERHIGHSLAPSETQTPAVEAFWAKRMKTLGSPDQPRDEQGRWTSGGGDSDRYDHAKASANDPEIAATASVVPGDPTTDIGKMSKSEYEALPLVYRGGNIEGEYLFVTNNEALARIHGQGIAKEYRLRPGSKIYADPEEVGFAGEALSGMQSLTLPDGGSAVVRGDALIPARYTARRQKSTSPGKEAWRGASISTDLATTASDALRSALESVLQQTLLKVVAAGGEVGVALLLRRLRTAGDYEGHEFHGNQYVEKGAGDSERAHGDVVAKSKYGQVEIVKRIDGTINYLGRRRDGENVGTFKKLNSAKDALRTPKNKEMFPSGHRSPDVQWKHLEAFRTLEPQAKVALPVKVAPLKMRFDAQNPEVIAWAKQHSAELVTQITETTRDRIRLAVEELQEEGDWELATDRIMAAVGDIDRADLIARHETMLAASEGNRLAWDQAVDEGLLTGDEQRVWIITPDERLCPICEELEDKTASLDGEYPGGFDGPPAHVQCRCTEGII